MNKLVVVGATNEMINDIVKPVLEKHPDWQFCLVTIEKLTAKQNNIQIIKKNTILDVISSAIKEIKNAKNGVLIKGLVPTADLLRAVLKAENGLRGERILSQITRLELLDENLTFFLTDPALNIEPDVTNKREIVLNAVEMAKKTGIEHPKVALLSSIEIENDKVPSSRDAAEVAEYFADHPIDAIVEGPISMDIAINKSAARIKQYKGKIQGNANILVVPQMDSGNILYKALANWVKVRISGVVYGAKIPLALTSRSDSPEIKVASIELAMELARAKENLHDF